MFKLRKTRQKLALLLIPLPGTVHVAAQGTGYKNRRLGKTPGVRFDSRLVLFVLYDALMLSLPARTSSVSRDTLVSVLRASSWVLLNFTVTPAENFLSPLSESSPSPCKKKSQFRRTTVSSSKPTFANPSKLILLPLDSALNTLKLNSR